MLSRILFFLLMMCSSSSATRVDKLLLMWTDPLLTLASWPASMLRLLAIRGKLHSFFVVWIFLHFKRYIIILHSHLTYLLFSLSKSTML